MTLSVKGLKTDTVAKALEREATLSARPFWTRGPFECETGLSATPPRARGPHGRKAPTSARPTRARGPHERETILSAKTPRVTSNTKCLNRSALLALSSSYEPAPVKPWSRAYITYTRRRYGSGGSVPSLLAQYKSTLPLSFHSGLNTSSWWMLRYTLRIRRCYCLFINFCQRFFRASDKFIFVDPRRRDRIEPQDLWNATLIDFNDSELRCPCAVTMLGLLLWTDYAAAMALCLLLKWQC